MSSPWHSAYVESEVHPTQPPTAFHPLRKDRVVILRATEVQWPEMKPSNPESWVFFQASVRNRCSAKPGKGTSFLESQATF